MGKRTNALLAGATLEFCFAAGLGSAGANESVNEGAQDANERAAYGKDDANTRFSLLESIITGTLGAMKRAYSVQLCRCAQTT